jgi:hypothetical protein
MRDEHGMRLPIVVPTRQAMYAAEPELSSAGQWICIGIQPTTTWPVRAQSLTFAGHQIWIVPLTEEDDPGVAMKLPEEMHQDDAEAILYRFLSVLSWRENCGIVVAYRRGGGIVRMMGRKSEFRGAVRDGFDFTEVICPEDEQPRIALALMREARSLNHHGYAFLSYWRVLELAYPVKANLTAWMIATLPTLTGHDVQLAIAGIGLQGFAEIQMHLYASSRCAVAHAASTPIVNPDDPRDARRLYSELPIVRELAIRAIEERFGIDSRSTEFRKHLYELRGWKEVLGPERVANVLAGIAPQEGEMIDLPRINVRLRECSPYPPMEDMGPSLISIENSVVNLEYRTGDGMMAVRFSLNLADERLEFDISNGLFGHDDGSVAAAEYRCETQRFIRDYLMNGELQVWNAETGVLLSRCDAFMPVNCMVNLDGCNANIAAAQQEVKARKAALETYRPDRYEFHPKPDTGGTSL